MEKIKNLLSALLMLSVVLSTSSLYAKDPDKKIELKPESVEIKWKGYKVTGEHDGLINLKEGSLEFINEDLSGGKVLVDMTSIKNLDMQGEYALKLEKHLKSDDFFGVDTYPIAELSIVSVEKSESGYSVIGALKIKKDTHQIKFPVTVEKTENGKLLKAKITIDRSKYDVRYGSTSFFDSLGDKAIYDDFDLWISIKM